MPVPRSRAPRALLWVGMAAVVIGLLQVVVQLTAGSSWPLLLVGAMQVLLGAATVVLSRRARG